MQLGITLGYSGGKIKIPMDLIKTAESLGYDSVWTAEAYGSDAVSPAAWILANTQKIRVGTAIMQMSARTPAMAAMTAMTLAQLSEQRFMLGIGASGPQVVEGWHGVPYGRPLLRTREYIEIMRMIFARQGPVSYAGKHYQMPYKKEDSTGLGKALKSILHCAQNIPIYTASITPLGVAVAAEVADGFFPIWMDPERHDIFQGSIEQGFAKAGNDKSLSSFDIMPFVSVVIGDDIKECMLPLKSNMALYIGGMGAKNKNFYNDYAKRLGFEAEAVKIQDLYLAGHKDEATMMVPDELVDACHLVGPAERIKDRCSRWLDAGKKGQVSSMLIAARQPEALQVMAEAILS